MDNGINEKEVRDFFNDEGWWAVPLASFVIGFILGIVI